MSDLEERVGCRIGEKARKKRLRDVKLIRLVRDHRALYETNDKDYHSYVRREKIWRDIAQQMGRKPDECRRRWVNIRDCFRKNLVKRQRGFTEKPINFEKELSFMVTHLTNSKPIKRFDSEEDNLDDDPLTSITEDMDEYVEGEEESFPPELIETLEEEEEPVPEADVDAATQIHDILQELVSWRREEQQTKIDHIGTYFKSIEETVRTLPWALQIEAKKQISSLVFDLELKGSGEVQPRYDAPQSSGGAAKG